MGKTRSAHNTSVDRYWFLGINENVFQRSGL
jgi:hypothetical protein